MENISIKDYIINNFKDDNKDSLERSINECLKEKDEVTLPGLGIFLSLIWQGSNDELKKSMIDILYNEIKSETTK